VGASVSENGTLVYAAGGSQEPTQLTWFDRAGRVLATLGETARYVNLALSPDERRVAASLGSGSPENVDIWIIDIARNVRSRLTSDPGADTAPVWSPDGTRIAFAGERSGKLSVRQKVIDGTAADEALLEASNNVPFPNGWSPDGRFIVYSFTESFPIRSNVWFLPLFGDRKPFPLAKTRFIEGSGVFSPDGRWIAYMSDESGQPNVYVQPFPASGPKYPMSRGWGGQPVWRADGRELFYLGADGTLMAVPIGVGAQFDAGTPQPLFATNVPGNKFYSSQVYAVTRDGERFLLPARPAQSRPAPLTVLVNWQEELKQRVPTR